ncbi:hypothetical protein [Cytobacillus purgationiresistens]|uniref:Uncharacterized protein n=1 Tax=Cytobacillus purgationiresistens TaxID=863449 RepID=A0ABU0AMF9_9BACI|nr:hypothetical protein [Cytobacillus purgationiresistens]MDQ0271235.1 hypothetical protein [Cytobacillus purgationiresistens]
MKKEVDYLKEIVKYNESETKKNGMFIAFEFNGVMVTNPFYDETMRYEVKPSDYYGQKNIDSMITEFTNLGTYPKYSDEKMKQFIEQDILVKSFYNELIKKYGHSPKDAMQIIYNYYVITDPIMLSIYEDIPKKK